jgi:hypothetical protein
VRTKPIAVSPEKETYAIVGEAYTKECTFFYEKVGSKIEPKTADIRVVRKHGGFE